MSRPPGPPPPPGRRSPAFLSVVPTPTEPREIKGTTNIPPNAACQCFCFLWMHKGTCTGTAELAISGDMYPGIPIYMCQACEDDIQRQTA